jgi:hypothetical protein
VLPRILRVSRGIQLTAYRFEMDGLRPSSEERRALALAFGCSCSTAKYEIRTDRLSQDGARSTTSQSAIHSFKIMEPFYSPFNTEILSLSTKEGGAHGLSPRLGRVILT